MFDKYIDEFILSADMKKYLKDHQSSVDTIAEIIYYSPTPIEKKKRALSELLIELDVESDTDMVANTEVYLNCILEAEKLIKTEGVFSIELCSYDAEREFDCEFDGLFNDFEDLLKYVKQDMEEWEVHDEELWYYEVVKWINDASGKLVEACTYWIVRGEIWFVSLNGKVLDDINFDVCVAHDLNLPVPFKAGDIVAVDLYPFGEKQIFEIIEVGDNRDCCCLQALSRKRDGNWITGAVKHGHIGDSVILPVSPLYSIEKYNGEIPAGYDLLEIVRDFIDGSEERGASLWNAIYSNIKNHEFSKEELLEVLETIRQGEN